MLTILAFLRFETFKSLFTLQGAAAISLLSPMLRRTKITKQPLPHNANLLLHYVTKVKYKATQ